LSFDELAIVGGRFHVRPLLGLLQDDGRFYVLAVSQNAVRLHTGSRYSISPLDHAGLPKNLVEALDIDEYRSALEWHGFRAGSTGVGGARAMFHGQGGSGGEVIKRDELRQFFRRLDAGLREMFHDESAPLLFAGVEYLFPLFREANSYRGLLERPLAGNPDLLTAKELHARAWSAVQPVFQAKRLTALRRYGDQAARGLASAELQKVLAAARQGAVETLFVASDRQCWGTFNGQGGQVVRHRGPEAGGEDLLDHAVVQGLAHRSAVYAVPAAELPAGDLAAAIFRYPLPDGG
jgi:hypothetical protein